METVLEETVSSEDLKRFEQKYHTELQEGKVSFIVYGQLVRQALSKFSIGKQGEGESNSYQAFMVDFTFKPQCLKQVPHGMMLAMAKQANITKGDFFLSYEPP